MAVISLLVAVVTAILASLFSGYPRLLPVFLFFVLLLLNCACMAANVCEEDKTSTLFMAVIYSSMTVLMCITIISKNLNGYLCEIGLQDPEKVHLLVPMLTVVLAIFAYMLFLRRAKKGRLLLKKYGSVFVRNPENQRLLRYRQMMIKEGILTERLSDDEEA